MNARVRWVGFVVAPLLAAGALGCGEDDAASLDGDGAAAAPDAGGAGAGSARDAGARDGGPGEPGSTGPSARDGGGIAGDGGAPGGSDAGDGATLDGGAGGDDGGCALGTACRPIEVDAFPFTNLRDTREAPAAAWDRYACAPDTDESGGELVYRLRLDTPGLLTASVDDVAGNRLDVDVHLLRGGAVASADPPDPDTCVARDNVTVSERVDAGTWFVVVDTWVGSDGEPRPAPYTLSIDFRPHDPSDPCAFAPRRLRMFWRACDPSVPDCVVTDEGVFLDLPTRGPVVLEAHLVTDADGFGDGWPTSLRDEILTHYARSEAVSGYAMQRGEPWAPEGEGGSHWGQAAYTRKLPVLDEAWYVNMYWRERPAPGTRMLLRNPANGRVVVLAAGYETGPGSNTAIGGASEEAHHALGSSHRTRLELGFAADPDLPLGPLDCGP